MKRIANKSILVLMATYNGTQFLKQQIESILNQAEVDVEILVRDDNSSDGTIDLLNEYASKTGKVHLISATSEDKHGPMQNYYSLIRIAQEKYAHDFEYFAFSDQDDIWDSDKLKQMLGKFKNSATPQLVYSDYRIIDKAGKTVLSSADDQIGLHFGGDLALLFGNSYAWGHSEVFNRELLLNVQIDDELLESNFPHDVYFAKMAVFYHGLHYLPEQFVSYRRYSENVSDIKYKLNLKSILNKINLLRQAKIYSNVLNGTLSAIEKNKDNAFFDKELGVEVKNVIFRGGFSGLKFLRLKGIKRKQKIRDISFKFIFLTGLYKTWLGKVKRLEV